ncbi:hypothetical protein [Rudaea sp.]|uniref:hypothetical protein n=1 Tax=Rudaea sp. TaxID=2136325 RepID=UPI0037849CA2
MSIDVIRNAMKTLPAKPARVRAGHRHSGQKRMKPPSSRHPMQYPRRDYRTGIDDSQETGAADAAVQMDCLGNNR